MNPTNQKYIILIKKVGWLVDLVFGIYLMRGNLHFVDKYWKAVFHN